MSIVILEQYQEAIAHYEEQLRITRELGDRAGEGRALGNLGNTYYHLGHYQQSLGHYQRALALLQDSSSRAEEGTVLSNIGQLLAQQEQPELAIVFYKQSVNVWEEIRSSIKSLPQEQQQSFKDSIADDYRELADLLLQQNRILEAQRILDLLKVQELDDYLHTVRSKAETESGIDLIDPETEISNKAILVGHRLAQLNAELDQIPLDEWSEAQHQELDELNADQKAIIDDFEGFIASPEIQALIDQLTVETREQDLLAELERLKNLQNNLRALDQNAVMIYPLILEDRLELVIVTPFSEPSRYPVEVDRTELNRAIAQFRQSLTTPTSDPQPIAHQLYRWLIAPMANDLKAIGAETILYAPDGPLRYIPLAALHDGDQWLTEQYRVNHITAASLQNLTLRPDADPKILAAAFSEGSVEIEGGQETFPFNGLPFAGTEVANLADRFPTANTLFNTAFTRAIIERVMDNHTIVHLATHATFLNGSPSDSFIVFGNGDRLTLEDLKGWEGTLNNVELFVLSACETGLGGPAFGGSETNKHGATEGENEEEELGNGAEILGFGYLMQLAGAEAAIASLWQVSDGGTQTLMDAFYTALNNGHTKAEALRRAQLALIHNNASVLEPSTDRGIGIEWTDSETPLAVSNQNLQGPLSHPYYWAPFILIGNGL